jgi:hypothetical protein
VLVSCGIWFFCIGIVVVEGHIDRANQNGLETGSSL